jgi:Tfp pilus assembly protein PilX
VIRGACILYVTVDMNQKTIILTVILFALIVVGMFTFAKLRSSELQTSMLHKPNTLYFV